MKTRIVAIALLALVWAACSETETAKTSGVRLSALGAADNVVGIQYDIQCEDGTNITQYVPLEGELLPAHVDAAKAGLPFADYFTVLAPGKCTVKATAMMSPEEPAPDCASAEQEVTVVEGQTTEIVLEVVCGAPPTGALDAVAVVTSAPGITDVSYDPSKFILQCEELTVSVTAEGSDDIVMTFEVIDAPTDAVYTLSPSGSSFTFNTETPGAYMVLITVTSAGQSSTLQIPIHVSADPTVGEGCEPVAVSCECPDGTVCDPITGACLPCEEYVADFSVNPEGGPWVLTGDATWQSTDGGYVRLTEEAAAQRGILYNATDAIPAGDASISFDFRISDTFAGQADGLAMTIVNLAPAASLATVVSGTEDGGGIGYHHPDAITNGDVISAVTIEIDQFYNTASGFWGTPAEVTSEPHLAVHTGLNSRVSGMIDYVELVDLPDTLWHTATVDIVGGALRISIDGTELLVSTPGLNFEGGYIFFSSSTGSQADVHEIDAVRILGGCE